ncbi:hypothetical protein ACOMHN_059037 [Nucella lapillus]
MQGLQQLLTIWEAANTAAVVEVVSTPTIGTTEIIPSTSAEIIPSTSAEIIPSTSAEIIPSTSAEIIPSTSAEIIPSTSAEIIPSTSAEIIPSTSAEIIPSTSAEIIPSTSAETTPHTDRLSSLPPMTLPALTDLSDIIEEADTDAVVAESAITSDTNTNSTDSTSLDGVVLPPRVPRKGRPRGSSQNAIGLPSKRRRLDKPQPFNKKTLTARDRQMLGSFVGPDKASDALNSQLLIGEEDVEQDPIAIPEACLDDSVNVDRLHRYFDGDGGLMSPARAKSFWYKFWVGVLDDFDDLVLGCGTGKTAAGLAVANSLTGGHLRLHAVCARNTSTEFYSYLDVSLRELGLDHLKSQDLVRFVDGYKSRGYTLSTDEELKFIQQVAAETSLVLDPVYGGKAALAMVTEMHHNPSAFKGRRILFIHTVWLHTPTPRTLVVVVGRSSPVKMANSSDDMENAFSEETADEEITSSSKRPRVKRNKTCGVCGDRALGYNFNAITCESCKAFFRRNAFKDTQIQCLFEGSCVIDLRTRRFCPACRIKRCLEIGMKRDMILDESERKARMTKVLRNRARKQSTGMPDTIKKEPLDADELSAECSSVCSPTLSETGSSTSESPEKLFQQISPERFPADPVMYRRLSDEERLLLNDIAICYETTVAAMPDVELSKPENYQNVNDLVNNTEICVRQLIKFVKRLDDFRLLSQEDQITSLKGAIMKSQLLRSVAFYSIEKDAWLTQKKEIPTSILREATGLVSLHNLHVSYCRMLKSIVLNNFTLYGLMQVMLIFHPDAAKLMDRELMSNLQDKYISLLKHYLEAEFSFEFAQEYFVAILGKMSELKSLSDKHSRILLQVNPSQVEPLMLEVLNLK